MAEPTVSAPASYEAEKQGKSSKWKTCCGGCCLFFVVATLGGVAMGYWWHASGRPWPHMIRVDSHPRQK